MGSFAGRIGQKLYKPAEFTGRFMGKYTKSDIVRMIEEEDVEFIRLQFVDLYGQLKNMAVTPSQLDKMLENKCMFDGAAIDGFSEKKSPELFLEPDLDTFTIFPWRPQSGKVARFICNVKNADGTPFEGDSRYVLQKVLEEAEEMGFSLNVGPECRFYLFDLDEDGNPTTHSAEKGGYFDIGPIDSGENVRREMVLFLEDMGFEIESSYHEEEAAHHGIDFKYDNALRSADNIVTFKLVVRNVAKRHGVHATFMPKPRYGLDGSGMHLSVSLAKNGVNMFTDKNDPKNMSQLAYQFMAGIMEHIEGMTLINNPIVNSYKRLMPGYGAPVNITCSTVDRSATIRMTSVGGNGTRMELRSPDGASNPYLVLALILASGLDGIKRGLKPTIKIDEEITEDNKKHLPSTLEDAIRAFEKDSFIQKILGKHISEKYIESRKKEWNTYCAQVTKWEVDSYLNRI